MRSTLFRAWLQTASGWKLPTIVHCFVHVMLYSLSPLAVYVPAPPDQ
jgi:hypothetical protein